MCRCGDAQRFKGEAAVQNRVTHRIVNQHAAQHDTQNDGGDREAFNPAVGKNQFYGRQKFGENTVFGRGVCCSADTHHGISQKRMGAEKHQKAPAHFEHIGEKHHSALRHRISEKPHVGRQTDVAHDKEEL